MDVTAVNIDLLDDLTLDGGAQTEHTVSRRVLRTDIDHILLLVEELVVAHLQFTILKLDLLGLILSLLVGRRHGVEFRIGIIILTQRITFPVVTQEQTTHIGMSDKTDTEIVEHFTFVKVGRMPQV